MRWLLLPEEERQYRRLRGNREATLFIEFFWRRRDPTPAEPGNPFLEMFHERVRAADQLYGEEETRGSLTDRGRALILLGPPPVLRHRRLPEPVAPARPQGFELLPEADQQTALEIWEYPPERLPPGMWEMLDEGWRQRGVALTFSEGPRRTRLVEGDEVLDCAARALASQPLHLAADAPSE